LIELAQEVAWDQADVAAEALGDLVDQQIDERVRDLARVQLGVLGREQVAQGPGHRAQAVIIEGPQDQLRLAQAGELAVLREFDAVVQRRQAGDAVARVEELRGAGEQPQQPLVGAGGVANLPDAVERLVPRVSPHAQDRLGLVDDDQQALVAGRVDHADDAAQVGHRVAAADVAADVGDPLGARGHVGAARQPREQRGGLGQLAGLLELEDLLDRSHELGRGLVADHRGQLLAELGRDLGVEVGGVRVGAGVN
jgi:hypothetical protein